MAALGALWRSQVRCERGEADDRADHSDREPGYRPQAACEQPSGQDPNTPARMNVLYLIAGIDRPVNVTMDLQKDRQFSGNSARAGGKGR